MKLANKVALITGAASGMGKSAALIFAKEGAKVAAVDIDAQQVQQTASEIANTGGQALALRADVSRSEDVQKMVEETVAHFGALNIVYNNAGIEGESNFVSNMTEEQFDRVIAINLRGVFLGMKYALPHLIKAGRLHYQSGLDRRIGCRPRWRRLLRRKGRRDRAHPGSGARIRPLQHSRQRNLPRRDRNADGAADSKGGAAQSQSNSANFGTRKDGRTRGDRQGRAVPGQ